MTDLCQMRQIISPFFFRQPTTNDKTRSSKSPWHERKWFKNWRTREMCSKCKKKKKKTKMKVQSRYSINVITGSAFSESKALQWNVKTRFAPEVMWWSPRNGKKDDKNSSYNNKIHIEKQWFVPSTRPSSSRSATHWSPLQQTKQTLAWYGIWNVKIGTKQDFSYTDSRTMWFLSCVFNS